MSDPGEVVQVNVENPLQPDPQYDPNGGISPDGVPYPAPDPQIGEEVKW